MNYSEAVEWMTEAYEELSHNITLGLPLTEKVMEDVWFYYCQGITPTKPLRKALVKALRDAE